MKKALLCTLIPRVATSFSSSMVDNPKAHGAQSDFAPCTEAQQGSTSAPVRIREVSIVVSKGPITPQFEWCDSISMQQSQGTVA